MIQLESCWSVCLVCVDALELLQNYSFSNSSTTHCPFLLYVCRTLCAVLIKSLWCRVMLENCVGKVWMIYLNAVIFQVSKPLAQSSDPCFWWKKIKIKYKSIAAKQTFNFSFEDNSLKRKWFYCCHDGDQPWLLYCLFPSNMEEMIKMIWWWFLPTVWASCWPLRWFIRGRRRRRVQLGPQTEGTPPHWQLQCAGRLFVQSLGY